MYYNFKISEICRSDTATRLKIDNLPKEIKIYDNIMDLIVNLLQPMRDLLGKPIYINSGYRCDKLNKAIGGATTSHHKQGYAVDIRTTLLSSREFYEWIKKAKFYYTQLILEKSNNVEWVHISYIKGNLKCQNMIYENGIYKLDNA